MQSAEESRRVRKFSALIEKMNHYLSGGMPHVYDSDNEFIDDLLELNNSLNGTYRYQLENTFVKLKRFKK